MQLLKRKVSLDKFLPHVKANTIGSEEEGMMPDNVALSFIRNSAIAFAERSGVLTETIKIDLQCGLDEYPIETSDESTVIGIKSAELGDFNSQDCGLTWSWGEVMFEVEDDVLKIWPVPDKDIDRGLELEVVVAPSREACSVDAQLYTKYFDAIIDGALFEIHMMPNYPWSSVSRADYRRRQFDDKISKASVNRVLKGNRRPMKARLNSDWKTCRTYRRRW